MSKFYLVFLFYVFYLTFCFSITQAESGKSPHEYLQYITQSLRYDSMKLALELMDNRQPNVLVETGTSRGASGDENYMFLGDGGSSFFFSTWAEINGKIFYSVDIDQVAINAARNAIGFKNDTIHFICDDSINFLRNFKGQIDFLYLDSFDYDFDNPAPSQVHHLHEIMAAYDKLTPHTIIMIDDCSLPGGGKGGLVIPYLLERNWIIIYSGYQIILVHSDSI